MNPLRTTARGVSRPSRLIGLAALVTASVALSACGDSSEPATVGEDDTVAVTLITKDSVNPFFVAMQDGAQEAAGESNVDLTIGSGKEDGDEAGQVEEIENAIARGDNGILITPNGPGVNPAIEEARDAGMFVIALDTPPDPADTVDITFATDNFKAGQLIGQWTAEQLGGEKATIALLDLFDDKVVSVDYNRDQGFLDGMGIELGDPQVNGDEEASGQYAAGQGGDYEIVCNEPTQGTAEEGKTAMENCLQQSGDINVVYTINEPSAVGADQALEAAGIEDALVVSVDGGCDGVQQVADGIIGATAQQYPLDMAKLGVEAIAEIARGGEEPETTGDLGFYDTGVALVTDQPVDGVDSIDTAEGTDLCWG